MSRATNGGGTAVMLAAGGGLVEAIRALAQLGADVTQSDDEGKTPLQYAEEGGHDDAVAWLRSKRVCDS